MTSQRTVAIFQWVALQKPDFPLSDCMNVNGVGVKLENKQYRFIR